MSKVRVDQLQVGDVLSFDGDHAEIVSIHHYNLAQGDNVIGTSNTESGNRWPVIHILATGQSGIVRFPHETLHRVRVYGAGTERGDTI